MPTANTAFPTSPASPTRSCASAPISRSAAGFSDRPPTCLPCVALVLHAATAFTRLTTGLQLTDTHNGLRAMTRRGASVIKLRQNRMAHASEYLAQIARSGLRYVEQPVTIEYSAYSLAKGQHVRDAVHILLDLFARRLYR
jgi:hypothetical protein